jgi:mercuric ion transport protein
MRRKSLLKFGIAGTVVTAICCFTPALVVLLGAVGLSAWLGWLDSVLIPLLVVFMAITAFAFAGVVSAARHSESSDESTQ